MKLVEPEATRRGTAPRPASHWRSEPLLHFLFLGAMLFALYAWTERRTDTGGGTIVVTAGRVRSLAETFARQWNRAPSPDELAGLVREFVREEALTREAIALGLDRGDSVVRRRLAQKMEFLFEDDAAAPDPTDDELGAYLAEHPDAFRLDARFTFTQITLDRDRRGSALAADAARLLAVLDGPDSPADLDALSDSRLLPVRQVHASQRDVEAQFGAPFAARLATLPAGRWHGPIESPYGAHLVRLDAYTPGRLPPLEAVRDTVAREWAAARERTAREARLQAILARYDVTVEVDAVNASAAEQLAEAGR